MLITQIELIIITILLIWTLVKVSKKKQKKPDALLRHVKEYLAEGYTFGQVKEKLKKIGFDKERINKVMTDFLRH